VRPLVKDGLAGRLFGAGEDAAHHHAAGTSGDGLGDVTRVADAAVGDQRHAAALERPGHAVDGGICGTPTPATMRVVQMRARADADLHRIGAGFHQRQRGRAGGDVAADHVDLRVVPLDPAHAIDDAGTVAVRGVDHQHVDAGLHQQLDPLLGALAHAHRRAHAQLALASRAAFGEARSAW
jgi:hypothetical protein